MGPRQNTHAEMVTRWWGIDSQSAGLEIGPEKLQSAKKVQKLIIFEFINILVF